MAITLASDVFCPQVVGDTALDVAFDRIDMVMSRWVQDARGTALEKEGNTIVFPRITALPAVQTAPADGSAVTPDKITVVSTDTATVENQIVSWEFTIDVLQDIYRMANPTEWVRNGLIMRMWANIQNRLIAKAATTDLTFTCGATNAEVAITYKSLKQALVRCWGENGWDDNMVFVCHPNVCFDLEMTEEALKLGLSQRGESTIETGKVRRIAGIQVLPLKCVTHTGEGADAVYNNIILRMDLMGNAPLGIYPKMAITPKEYDVPNSTSAGVHWMWRDAVHLYLPEPTPSILFKCKSTEAYVAGM